MHKFILMFAILATISMSSLAEAQRPDGQRSDRQRPDGAQREGGPRGGGGQRGGGQRGEQRGPRPVSPMMTALDTDKDGELSSQEIANAATALKTLDKNEDGVLDATELGSQRGDGNSSAMADRVMERDADKDGKVSKEEAGDRMGRMFDRMDEDGDGFVTRAEIEKMSQQFQRGGGGGGRAGGGRGGRGGAGGGGNQPSTKKERPAFDE